jgi:hypothetical protein
LGDRTIIFHQNCARYPTYSDIDCQSWASTTVDKVKIDHFGVGLVQALQECSGDVKSIES